ncbi:MAG: PH domain-containing protein [Planctomycetota bacterium]|nr:PH domain-containing protein [Planctomycetota bacterium]
MATRYIVHGQDLATGQATRRLIEADSAKEAAAMAERIGVRVSGVEVDAGSAARSAGEPARHAAPPQHAPDVGEEPVWSGSPSQWENFWWFVACVLVIPVPFAIWSYIKVRTTRYTLTNQRLKIEWGVIEKNVEEVELYRVTDTAVKQSVVQRLLGFGTLWLQSSDQRNPEVTLRSIHDPREVREQIRQHAEARRRWRRVAEVEVS